MPKDVIGSVMVLGGGIAGMQAALDLADSVPCELSHRNWSRSAGT
jgi:heterodisulfide reductase subunit A-like polyferredoxin